MFYFSYSATLMENTLQVFENECLGDEYVPETYDY